MKRIIIYLLFILSLSAQFEKIKIFPLNFHQSAYSVKSNQLELIVPFIALFSHLRYYIGKDSVYTIQLGLGILQANIGFTRHLFYLTNKRPVSYRLDMGLIGLGSFFHHHQLLFGLQKWEEHNLSFSISSGFYGLGLQASTIAVLENIIYEYKGSNQSFISLNIGLIQHLELYKGYEEWKFFYQLSIQFSYLFGRETK